MSKDNEIIYNEPRTTMSLSLTVTDKQFLKIYAAKHETTVAAIIHELVKKLRMEDEK